MKGKIITGRSVVTDDLISAGMIQGESKKRTYTCFTCGKTKESASHPSNINHGCSKTSWYLKRKKISLSGNNLYIWVFFEFKLLLHGEIPYWGKAWSQFRQAVFKINKPEEEPLKVGQWIFWQCVSIYARRFVELFFSDRK